MKILQGIIEIAGQMGILTKSLKQAGHIAGGYNIFHSYLNYQDHLNNTTPSEIQNTYQHLINFYDVFHFHYGISLLTNFQDLPIIKAKGKKMVMNHWGNDVRFHDQARIHNSYVYTGDSPPNHEILHRLQTLGKLIDQAIVQDHEVYAYVAPFYKKVHVVPIAIDLERFQPVYPNVTQAKPLIIHAPTNPEFKGTAYIEQAIANIQKDTSIEYRRIQYLSHQEASRLYQQADIIIDQILCGSHGLLSVESMALGKPVIAYIREDLVPTFPSTLPIVNANPDTIEQQLRMLIDHPEKRYSLGLEGRKYVETYHASNVVAQKVLNIYAQL